MRLSPSILARATLAATLLALAAIGGACAWRLWQAADWLAALHPGLVEPFATDGVTTHAQGVGVLLAVAAVVAVAGGLAAFLPGRFALRLVRLGFWTSYLGLAAWLVLVTRGVGVIGEKKLMVDGLQQDAVTLFTPWWASTMERQMARPMPMPPSLVLQNGSKTLCRSASAMPRPRSAT